MGNFLIIRGANFSTNAVDNVSFNDFSSVQKELNNAELVVGTSSTCAKNTFELTVRKNIRASIMVKKEYALKSTPWTKASGMGDSSFIIDESHIQTHEMLSLPKFVKKIKINMTNTDYYYGFCVWGNKTGFIEDLGWHEANTPIEKDLSTYQDDFFWITSTIKKGSEGAAEIGEEITKETLGWSINIIE